MANFAVFIVYELPNLNSAVYHASFCPCTAGNACRGPEPWGVSDPEAEMRTGLVTGRIKIVISYQH